MPVWPISPVRAYGTGRAWPLDAPPAGGQAGGTPDRGEHLPRNRPAGSQKNVSVHPSAMERGLRGKDADYADEEVGIAEPFLSLCPRNPRETRVIRVLLLQTGEVLHSIKWRFQWPEAD